MARYRGRHRAPSSSINEKAAQAAVVGVAVLAPVILGAGTASAADNLDIIAQCESGNKNIPNSSGASTAGGYWQIVNGTWRAHGGTQFAPTAMQATRAEQRIVAERIVAARGSYADWNPSKPCWGGKISNAKHASGQEAATPAKPTKPAKPTTPKHAQPEKKTQEKKIVEKTITPQKAQTTQSLQAPRAQTQSAPGDILIRPGDTLSEIAKARGLSDYRVLYEKNRDTIANPDLIYAGNKLHV